MSLAKQIADRYGGDASGEQARIPTPGHSSKDRGTVITIDANAPDGVLVNCFNGGDPLAIKDMLRKDGLLGQGVYHKLKPNDESKTAKPHRQKPAEVFDHTNVWFDYRDLDGNIVYRVERVDMDKKSKAFFPYIGDGNGGWRRCQKGEKPDSVLYRWPDIVAAPKNDIIFMAEGERKADKLAAWGFAATSSKFIPKDIQATFEGRTVAVLPDNDDIGEKIANDMIEKLISVGAKAFKVYLPDLPEKGDIIDWKGDASELIKLTEAAIPEVNDSPQVNNNLPPPQPLQRALAPSQAYPIADLGSFMADAVNAAVADIKLPASVAAGSALAHASLASQGHISVRLPHGQVTPASLFMVSLASSGDRKSAVDRRFGEAAEQREKQLNKQSQRSCFEGEAKAQAYQAKKNAILKNPAKYSFTEMEQALVSLGEPPARPRGPMLLATDPTIEAVHKNLASGQSSQAIFSDEGAQFTQGFGMSKENAVKTSAGLSGLWDASPIRRSRSLDGNTILHGRRVCLHLMLQVEAGLNWLGDRSIRDQGLFGRILVACPETLKGTRLIDETSPWKKQEHEQAIGVFKDKLTECFNRPMAYVDEESGELEPRILKMTADAESRWIGYHNVIEELICPSCTYHPIASLAAKAGEHVARLAGVTAFFNDPDITEIDEEDIERGINLMNWYLDEALRIVEASAASPEIRKAERLLDWFHEKWIGETVSLPDLYGNSAGGLRDKAQAKKIVDILVDHDWITPVDGSRKVKGKMRREVFHIRREHLPYDAKQAT